MCKSIFARNFKFSLVKGKFYILWFEGAVSPMSLEPVCINDKEEENIKTTFESDSGVYSDSKNNILH